MFYLKITEKSYIKQMLYLSLLLLFSYSSTSVKAESLPNVAMKVLVISPTAETNELTPEGDVNPRYARGLDTIDDMLDEMGVPYDVLDASNEELTEEKLVTKDSVGNVIHGNYNGIILTHSYLYYPDEAHPNYSDEANPNPNPNPWDSAFTLKEWQLLHEYERNFKVRESVMSGDPISWCWAKDDLDLDYGMADIEGAVYDDLSAEWDIPDASDNEIFEYVNRGQPVTVIGEKFLASPRSSNIDCSSEVTLDAEATPLLIDQISGKALISRIKYPDGREVLLSTITNSFYLMFSQVLNYEFLNFATQGVFIGSRKVYLAAHIDDIFLDDELWNIDTNTTGPNSYLTTAADIKNVVNSNSAFISNNEGLLSDFKLDFVYNGLGAARLPLVSNRDTYIDSYYRNKNYSQERTAYSSKSRYRERRALFYFSKEDNGNVGFPEGIDSNPAAESAILTLTLANSPYRPEGKVCLVTKDWGYWVNWYSRLTYEDCVNYRYKRASWYTPGILEADVTDIVNKWIETKGNNNFGFILTSRWGTKVQVYTRNESNENLQPKLFIEYKPNSQALTDAIVANADHFRFINHTLTHRKLFESTGATEPIVFAELDENLKVWEELNLPDFANSSKVLVTGEHSGLENGTYRLDIANGGDYEIDELISYPRGLNHKLVNAMESLGIEYIASDSSRVCQNKEHFLPSENAQVETCEKLESFDYEKSTVMMLPRYPTSVFYNVSEPGELTDEYNYIFFERYQPLDSGVRPCDVDPGAICETRSYSEILAAEAETTLRHMLTFKPWPHYFHSANLKNYGDGNTLVYDWLEAVVNNYKSYMQLPIINIDFLSHGEMSKEKLAAKEANVRGVWERNNGTVTVTADSPVTVRMTGVQSTDIYGGQYQLEATVDGTETFIVNRLLD